MSKRSINPPRLPPPMGPFAQVVVAKPGDLVFCAGTVALDAAGKIVGEGDVTAQTRQIMENLQVALEAGGATFADVVKITNYLTDASAYRQVADVRERYLTKPYPASTLIEVKALLYPELLVEIEAIAVVSKCAVGSTA